MEHSLKARSDLLHSLIPEHGWGAVWWSLGCLETSHNRQDFSMFGALEVTLSRLSEPTHLIP